MNRKLIYGLLVIFILGIASWWGINQIDTKETNSTIFYVPNAGEGTISVVDSLKGSTIDTIELGTDQASHGIALSIDGRILYSGTGFIDKTLVAIDTKTKKIIKELKFNEGVHGIDISPDGKTLYVSLVPGLGEEGGGLAIVDSNNLELKTIVDTTGGPAHVAVKPDGTQIWVANVNGDTVAVIDAQKYQLLKVIPVGKVPNEVAITPDGKWAFAANVGSDTVTMINTETLRPVKVLYAGDDPHGVSISRDGKEIWVANNKSNDVTVIDINTFQTIATISTGAYANHVAFSVDGETAYVTNRQSNDVVKIDANKKIVVSRFPVGVEPHEITLEDYVVPSKTDSESFTTKELKTIASEENLKAGKIISEIDNTYYNPPNEEMLRTAEVGSIYVDALLLSIDDLIAKEQQNQDIINEFNKYQSFRIYLTTHYGDLSTIPIKENVFLIDKDEKIAPLKWIVESNDSHHPQYLTVFLKPQNANVVTLEIGGIGEETVLLDWENE